MPAISYPFDPTGTNPVNRVTNEVHVITPVNLKHFNFFVPENGPFFADNFSMVFRHPDNSIWPMTEGVDYYFSHHFLSASKACAKPVYASITFLNHQTQGVVQISYNTVGGTWTATPTIIAQMLADLTYNPRTTTWEQVANLPYQFPVVDHEWNLVDMVGMSSVVAALEDIKDTLLSVTGGGLQSHIQNLNNPHGTTKTHIGLGNVQDYPIATQAQAEAGSSDTVYMTALKTKQSIDALVPAILSIHSSRTDNPHGTTKTHVGLGNVDDFSTASQLEAETGVANNRFMTPLRVKQAIASHSVSYDTHISRTDNPHGTNKTHVGLGNVQNYGIATLVQAQAGAIDTAYMTPSRVSAAITALALTPLNSHTTDTNNPHGTNKTQIGLSLVQNYPIASQEQATTGTSNDSYMTPLRVAQAIAALASSGSVGSHAADWNNPHNTTATQVGAYTTQEVDSLLLQKLGTNQTASDSSKFNGLDYAAAKADILQGQSADSILLAGMNPPQLFSQYGTQTKVHPVSYTTSSNYVWYKLATCSTNTDATDYTFESDEQANRFRAGQFLFAGGSMSGGGTNPTLEYRMPQLIYLCMNRFGNNYENRELIAINLFNNPSISGASQPNVSFGFVHNATTNQQSIYVRLLKDQPGFSLTTLDGLALNGSVDYHGDVEPVGIQYTVITNSTVSYPVATQAQIHAGTNNFTLMTPQGVVTAIGHHGRSLIGIRVFTPSSNGTAYVPTTGTKKVLCKVQAPGASGGASKTSIAGQANAGVGGGAGGYAEAFLDAVAIAGATLNIPPGGTACPANTDPGPGQNGQTCSIGGIISATGGVAGLSGIITNTPGYRKESGVISEASVGGNVAVSFRSRSGASMIIGNMAIGGDGGDSIFGPGAPGASADGVTVTTASGEQSIPYGAGGSGAASSGAGAASAGGQGGDGVIVIYEYA